MVSEEMERKDRIFWKLMTNLKLRLRFVKSTAIAIWTQGSFIPGDFLNKIYFLEVERGDFPFLKKFLDKNDISYSEGKLIKKRPLVYIEVKGSFNVVRKNNLPVIPLNEFIVWCKKLGLDNVLEQLDLLYHLNLKTKYAEIRTNI